MIEGRFDWLKLDLWKNGSETLPPIKKPVVTRGTERKLESVWVI